MTSRTRFCAPKPIASPAMPAPVRIGTMSIDSSRSSIRIATKPTDHRHQAGRGCRSASPRAAATRDRFCAWRRPSLNCRCIDRQVAAADDDERADDDDDDVDAVRQQPARHARGSHRGSPTPKRDSASDTLASAATPYASSVSARISCCRPRVRWPPGSRRRRCRGDRADGGPARARRGRRRPRAGRRGQRPPTSDRTRIRRHQRRLNLQIVRVAAGRDRG